MEKKYCLRKDLNMKDQNMDFEKYTVIVADGEFPGHDVPLGYLKRAESIVCCDGSAEKLIRSGYIPDSIVGDMDSLDPKIAARFADRIHPDPDQETNDLTKAVRWCSVNGMKNIVILGATGRREDHTIGNISLLADYTDIVNVIMVTDTGIFTAISESSVISCFPGQQVSIFSLDPATELTSFRLKYPLERKRLSNWWMATLNEAMTDSFGLEFTGGRLILYLKFES
jgi:thiamine pyrophosphokinase